MRSRTFTSIAELNEALWGHIHELNDTVMEDHGVSRNERFEVEKPSLQPVPTEDFEIPDVKEATSPSKSGPQAVGMMAFALVPKPLA